ncbi:DUF2231 domain-containing protein [Brevundimonas sp. DC300-4]|uniref:DUF2231 domain-containing protein n=1 Tax=Brevundimonas sp. DC300-4 TaxID=2804594 RepID=UPI003CF50922
MRFTLASGAVLNPVHAILLAFPVALFPGALVTDITYLRTEEMQWANFSAWLISGALVFNGLVLAWALVSLVLRFRTGQKLRSAIYAGMLALLFTVGLINAFQHSRDAWSSVGGLGLTLSILSTLFAIGAAIIAHTHVFSREVAR